ncbi:NADPH-dependent 7-cyano-7-deazaguanine reductase QueF [Pelistega sp. NLN82]|uniref:NADPH-dependent 7-cyano-7-deazaguanine reductase n=1 Tax=Pelistega ratti TaxID=2652177 RepID=A0A6L9Y532_9BURK|nr:NADPH-dependent 7-cyano-7-deazaguanine reductase QueF [Pelistega ratti]NEN74908.1 NADPH-dependent 7-cyano-7-deazaguanine reductase QueF [Pelistega ratti]
MTIEQELNHAPLGKSSEYPDHYDPSLLYPIPRSIGRQYLSMQPTPKWIGEDIWRAFEVSWLNHKGKPEIAILTFSIPASSTHIIESKSFKLYLNSFNQEKITWEVLLERLKKDLSQATGAEVTITREQAHTTIVQNTALEPATLDTNTLTIPPPLHAILLDNLDIECHIYEPTASLLKKDDSRIVKEVLISDLLKSNCPVTSQPDWGTVVISYEGSAIDHKALLQYIVSYRHHNGFHEQCVEQIYCDIMQQCNPIALEVYARYTRRGGLDINPRRQSPNFVPIQANTHYDQSIRTPRQ